MKNTFGSNVAVTLFGESHGEMIGAVLDGLTPGLRVDEDLIAYQLSLRRPDGDLTTTRVEADDFRIVSGVYAGRTTGTPLTVLIPNREVNSASYDQHLPRPGHADYAGYCKYHGFGDFRGGGHFSGRLTAPLVAAGAIALSVLNQYGVKIGSHIAEVAGVKDRPFQNPAIEIEKVNGERFPVLLSGIDVQMKEEIRAAKLDGDSVGGVIETAAVGLPAGLGEPWFDSVEGLLSHALFSVPAVKGVEFGDGFEFSTMRGSEANDAFSMKNGKVVTLTNHNGGINGGVTNGMPLIFRCVIKPTPSISLAQQTVDLTTGSDTQIAIRGRHDPCILQRARVVIDSVAALVLVDLLAGRYGTDFVDPE